MPRNRASCSSAPLVLPGVAAKTRVVLPVPASTELRRRIPRLLLGLVLFGLGLAFMVVADLGLAPWEVLHQGISKQTGIPIGTVGILTGILVLFLWIPLGERIGIGTVANVILIGVVIDLTLWVLPSSLDNDPLRWFALLGGVLLVAIGSGFYIGVGLGPGPRDGLMTGIARRGYPPAQATSTMCGCNIRASALRLMNDPG